MDKYKKLLRKQFKQFDCKAVGSICMKIALADILEKYFVVENGLNEMYIQTV